MHDRLEGWVVALVSSPILQAAILSFVLAIARVAYDNKETSFQRGLLEGSMSGLLTFIAGTGANWLGVSPGWTYIFGGVLAYVGLELFRKTVLDIVKVKFGRRAGDE